MKILLIICSLSLLYVLSTTAGEAAADNNTQVIVSPAEGVAGISKALSSATPGTRILVMKGQYFGMIKASNVHGTADMPITVEAKPGVILLAKQVEQQDLPKVQGSVIEIGKSSNLILRGFELAGGNRGITLGNCQSIRIENNIIHDVGNYGVMSYYSNDTVIRHNHIFRSFIEHGVYISGPATGLIVSDNLIEDTHINGLHMNGEIIKPLVERNIFVRIGCFPSKEGGAAITFINGAQEGTIRNNLFIDIYGQGIIVSSPKLIINNNIFDGVSWSVLLALPGAANMEFRGNIVREKHTIPFQFADGILATFKANYNWYDMGGQPMFEEDSSKRTLTHTQWLKEGMDTASYNEPAPFKYERYSQKPIQNNYLLNESSKAIDAGPPDTNDSKRPPGLSGERSDIGIYGGPGNNW